MGLVRTPLTLLPNERATPALFVVLGSIQADGKLSVQAAGPRLKYRFIPWASLRRFRSQEPFFNPEALFLDLFALLFCRRGSSCHLSSAPWNVGTSFPSIYRAVDCQPLTKGTAWAVLVFGGGVSQRGISFLPASPLKVGSLRI